MRLNWKRWRFGKTMYDFLDDNGIRLRVMDLVPARKKTKETGYVLILKDSTVLGCVREITDFDGKKDYASNRNTGTFYDLSSTPTHSHRTFAAALRDAVSTAAPYFNKDGSPTKTLFLPWTSRQEGKILWDGSKVIRADGRPSWLR